MRLFCCALCYWKWFRSNFLVWNVEVENLLDCRYILLFQKSRTVVALARHDTTRHLSQNLELLRHWYDTALFPNLELLRHRPGTARHDGMHRHTPYFICWRNWQGRHGLISTSGRAGRARRCKLARHSVPLALHLSLWFLVFLYNPCPLTMSFVMLHESSGNRIYSTTFHYTTQFLFNSNML